MFTVIEYITKFYEWGFRDNKYIWFHILAGGLGTLVFGFWWMIFMAVGWEIIEYYFDDVLRVYGDYERWTYDTLGDIVGAILCGLMVLAG